MKKLLLVSLFICNPVLAQTNDDIYQLFDNYNGKASHPVQPQPSPNGSSPSGQQPMGQPFYNNQSSPNGLLSGTNVFSDYDYQMWLRRDTCEVVLPPDEDFKSSLPLHLTLSNTALTKYKKSFHMKVSGFDNQPINFTNYSFYLMDESGKYYVLPNVKYNSKTSTFYALSLVPTFPNASCLDSGNYSLWFHAQDENGKYYNYHTDVSFENDAPPILKILKASSPTSSSTLTDGEDIAQPDDDKSKDN